MLVLTLLTSVITAGASTAVSAATVKDESVSADGKVTLNPETLAEIQKYTRGCDNPFGALIYYGKGLAGFVSFVKAVMELTGVLESHEAFVARRFAEIENLIRDLHNKVDKQIENLEVFREDLFEELIKNNVTVFNSRIALMRTKNELIKGLYKNAKDDYAPEVAIKGDPLPKTMKEANMQPKKWLDVETASDQEMAEYYNALTDIIINGWLTHTEKYDRYGALKDEFTSIFEEVLTTLQSFDSDAHPVRAYDRYCTYLYNFDTQAYLTRVAYRESILADLTEAMAMYHVLIKSYTNPNNYVGETMVKYYNTAVLELQTHYPAGITSGKSVGHPHFAVDPDENYTGDYISEIKVSADPKQDNAKNNLTKNGYTLIDNDLNRDANGYYIYLGYKKTKKYNEAIKDIVLRQGKDNHSDTWAYNGFNYSLCPYTSESGFVNSKGDLNCGAGGDYLRLYYTKDELPEGTAITAMNIVPVTKTYFNDLLDDILADPTKSMVLEECTYSKFIKDSTIISPAKYCDGEIYANFNGGLNVDPILMYVTKAKAATKYVEDDPAYYPYSYALGSRVYFTSLRDPQSYNTINSMFGKDSGGYALRYGESNEGRNWTTEEETGFANRMTAATLTDELKSAGIVAGNFSLLTSVNLSGQYKIRQFDSNSRNRMEYNLNNLRSDGYAQFNTMLCDSNVATSTYARTRKRISDNGRYYYEIERACLNKDDYDKKLCYMKKNGCTNLDTAAGYFTLVDSSDYTGLSNYCRLGDTNRDGVVDIRDVTALQRHLADMEALTGKALKAANIPDVSYEEATTTLILKDDNNDPYELEITYTKTNYIEDDEVTVKDATAIQQSIAEFENTNSRIGGFWYYM